MSQFVFELDCSLTNVTTTDYTELVAATDESCSTIQFLYHNPGSPDQHAKLAIGAVGSEVDYLICCADDPTPIPFYIQNGSRISAKAVGEDMTTGYLILALIP